MSVRRFSGKLLMAPLKVVTADQAAWDEWHKERIPVYDLNPDIERAVLAGKEDGAWCF